MFDDNCSLHTAAALYNNRNGTSVGVGDISQMTGYMEGPAHPPQNVAQMFRDLGISDGLYTRFTSLQQAEALMRMRQPGTMFGFAYSPRVGGIGHILVAVRTLGGVEYRDHQRHERFGGSTPLAVRSDNFPADCDYFVFRPSRQDQVAAVSPMDDLTNRMRRLSIG